MCAGMNKCLYSSGKHTGKIGRLCTKILIVVDTGQFSF